MNRALVAIAGLATIFVLALSVNSGSAEESEATYVGDSTCKKCHFKQHRYWKKTKLKKAMEALTPTAEADDKTLFDRKKAASLDPAKDYSKDAKCLACHTTGYRHYNGFDEQDRTSLSHVQCEACHGYGTQHVRNGDMNELARESCTQCHDDNQRPCYDDSKDVQFDFAAFWEKIAH